MDLNKLSVYLKEKNENVVELTFEEIEKILGYRLPPKAKKDGKWWWNIKDSKKAQTWINNGYYTFDCKNIPIKSNVCFRKNKLEKTEEIKGIKRVWYFLTDKDAELHQKVMAFLEILILPLIALLTLILTYISVFSTHSETTINNYYESVKSDSQIEIVNIDILDDEVTLVDTDNKSEIMSVNAGVYIDIKLRNTGDTVAFLKQIKFDMDEIFPLDNPKDVAYESVPVSETYDVILDDEYTQIIDVSQSIPANGVDRFRLKILSSAGNNEMDVIYVFRMEFIYDGDNKSISSARYVAVFPSYFNHVGECVYAFDYDVWLSNYNEIKRIEKFVEENDDIIVSPQFQDLLKYYESESKLSRDELINRYAKKIVYILRGTIDEEQWKNIKEQSDEYYKKECIED